MDEVGSRESLPPGADLQPPTWSNLPPVGGFAQLLEPEPTLRCLILPEPEQSPADWAWEQTAVESQAAVGEGAVEGGGDSAREPRFLSL